jgi:hypothetical protein
MSPRLGRRNTGFRSIAPASIGTRRSSRLHRLERAEHKRHLLGRTRTLDSHASRLRRKLGQAGAEDCVLNVWGVGYRLLADYEEARRSA